MKLTDNKLKQASLDLAEDSREVDWNHPSFVAELFKGNFAWGQVHPFPIQSAEDKAIGDAFIVQLDAVIKKHINPEEVDRTGIVPREALKALAEIGSFGMKIPKKYGGLGFSVINYNRAMMYLGSYCGSTTVWLSAHQSIGVPQPLKMFGTDAQKEKYLPRMAKGAVSAFALTEPGVGSDPANMKTFAKLSEDGTYYTLTGEKIWITNGPDSEIMVVMAQTAPKIVRGKEKKQITAFILETNSPGFEVVHHCEFMGIRGISNGLLRFNNIKIPAENVIGGEGQGLKIALVTLNTGRLTIPAAVAGMSKTCMNYNREWVKERVQWGQPIGKHQAVASKNAWIAAHTFAIESVTWLASAFADNPKKDIRLEAAITKYFTTEVAWEIADKTLQIHGGRGYETSKSLRERGEVAYPIERMLRDTRINKIIEGTSEIMQLFIAREAIDVHVKAIMGLMDSHKSIVDKLKLLVKSGIFYAWWYPKQWIRLPRLYSASKLSSTNRQNLTYVARTSKRMARTIFHAMALYQQRLEKEQLILGEVVDIGTNLFAMSAVLSYADLLCKQNPKDKTPNDVAELFCAYSRDKIAASFKSIKSGPRKLINKVSKGFFEDSYTWLEDGISV